MEEQILGILNGDITCPSIQRTLRAAFMEPAVLMSGLELLAGSSHPAVRKFLAVFFRSHFSTGSVWNKYKPTYSESVKMHILESYVLEKDLSVKIQLAELLSVMARHELSKGMWPQLENHIVHQTNIGPAGIEEALFLLEKMACTSFHIFDTCLANILNILENVLVSHAHYSSREIEFKAIMTLTHLWSDKRENELLSGTIERRMEQILEIIKTSSRTCEDQCISMLEMVEKITTSSYSCKHFDVFYNMVYGLCTSNETERAVKVKCMHLLELMCTYNKQQVLRNGSLKPMVELIFKCLVSPPDEEDNEEYYEDYEDLITLSSSAAQLLDSMSHHMPSRELLPVVFPYMEAAVVSSDQYQRKGAFVSLGLICEGCAGTIRCGYVDKLMTWIRAGIKDHSVVARTAAYFAFINMTENMQPEVCEYSEAILPELVQQLIAAAEQIQLRREQTVVFRRLCEALEVYCDALAESDRGQEMAPYLSAAVPTIVVLLDFQNPPPIHMAALKLLGSVIVAVKDTILPLLEPILHKLNEYIIQPESSDTLPSIITALDTLVAVLRSVETTGECYRAVWEESVALAERLACTDCVERCAAALALVGAVAASRWRGALARPEPFVLAGLRVLAMTESDNEPENNINETIGQQFITNSNQISSYLNEEKEKVCRALMDIAINMSVFFMKYVDKAMELAYDFMYTTECTTKEIAINTYNTFVNQKLQNGSSLTDDQINQLINKQLIAMCRVVELEGECGVVAAALGGVEGALVAAEGVVAAATVSGADADAALQQLLAPCAGKLLAVLASVITAKAPCVSECAEGWSEAEAAVAARAARLLPAAARVAPGAGSRLAADGVLAALAARAVSTTVLKMLTSCRGKHVDIAQYPTCAGDECWESSARALAHLAAPLAAERDSLPALLQLLRELNALAAHAQAAARAAAAAGLADLLCHARAALPPECVQRVLECLESMCGDSSAIVRDSVAGGLARMMLASSDDLPCDTLLRVLVARLPLSAGAAEQRDVLACLGRLFRAGHESLLPHLPRLVGVAAHALRHQPLDQESRQLVLQLVSGIERSFPEVVQSALPCLPEAERASILSILEGNYMYG